MSLATPAGALALNGLCERVLSCSSAAVMASAEVANFPWSGSVK